MNGPLRTPKDVFVSYKREERPLVMRLVEALREFGLTIWVDAVLEPGSSFDEEIAHEIRLARAVLVCWSEASVDSRWVRSEAMLAAKRNVLVPIFLQRCDPLPPFNLDHSEDLSDWTGQKGHDGWRKVLRRIGVLTGRGEALVAWLDAGETEAVEAYRRFLKYFPEDPLTQLAKKRLWTLELEATRRRLTVELGMTETTDAFLSGLEIQLNVAQSRGLAAETAALQAQAEIQKFRQLADAAIKQQNENDSARQSAEGRAGEAETRLLSVERALRVAEEELTRLRSVQSDQSDKAIDDRSPERDWAARGQSRSTDVAWRREGSQDAPHSRGAEGERDNDSQSLIERATTNESFALPPLPDEPIQGGEGPLSSSGLLRRVIFGLIAILILLGLLLGITQR